MIDYKQVRDKSVAERLAIAGQYYEAEEWGQCEMAISFILDTDPHNRGAISLLGALYQKLDRHGMAEMVYRYGLALHKDFVPMWIGLGTAISNPFRHDEAEKILNHALVLSPDHTVATTNLAALYVEIGDYEKAIELANKALKLNPASISAKDTIALASLGLEDFESFGRLNQESLGVKFRKEIIYGDEERWNGEKDKTVIIYGEQGLGDEIFYGSVIPDAIKDCKKVIIDCDPRLETLFQRSFPDAFVYGTRSLTAPWLRNHKWDYRCAIADLHRIYRKKKDDFTGKPFLKADPVRSKQWAETFGSNKKIGIAFRGGNKFTNRESRTIPLEKFNPLLGFGDLVSLEYSDFDYDDFPIEVYDWAMQGDYDNTAALVSQLDCVVTTCTAVVHLAGGLGIPCYVMTNKYPGGRYAHDMPWYNSVRVIHCDGDWEKGMEEVVKLIAQKSKAA